MASRVTINTTTKGVQMAAPSDNASSATQQNVYCSATTVPSGLRALQGATIRGQVVGTLERWADGGIWDTTNSRFLYAGSDFDPAMLNKA